MAKRWDYGEEGSKYPVKVGDVWQAGAHLLSCGDLEVGHGDLFLEQYGTPAMTFVDPPYGASRASSFRTKAASFEGAIERRSVDFDNLLNRLAGLAAGAGRPAYVEMGITWVPDLVSAMYGAGAAMFADYAILYYDSKPCRLLGFAWGDPPEAIPDLNGLDDTVAPLHAIRATIEPGEVVFDPMMGRGGTARSADDSGRVAWGIELHPARVSSSLAKLAERGYEPELVDRLKGVA